MFSFADDLGLFRNRLTNFDGGQRLLLLGHICCLSWLASYKLTPVRSRAANRPKSRFYGGVHSDNYCPFNLQMANQKQLILKVFQTFSGFLKKNHYIKACLVVHFKRCDMSALQGCCFFTCFLLLYQRRDKFCAEHRVYILWCWGVSVWNVSEWAGEPVRRAPCWRSRRQRAKGSCKASCCSSSTPASTSTGQKLPLCLALPENLEFYTLIFCFWRIVEADYTEVFVRGCPCLQFINKSYFP